MPLLVAQLEIASPGRLIVLVLLPALVYLALRGRREQPWWQKLTSTSLRCLVFTLLCVAWAVPACRRQSDRKFVVFAVDESASSYFDAVDQAGAFGNPLESASGEHMVRWLAFADVPYENPRSVSSLDFSTGIAPPVTNIARAIAGGRAACPSDHVPHVVLLTDGRQTDGDALAAAMAADVPISVVPLRSLHYPEVAVDAIIAPPMMARNESFEISVKLLSNRPGSTTVQLFRDGEPLAQEHLDFPKGEMLWRTHASVGEGDLTTFQVSVTALRDTFPENNSLSAVVARKQQARVMIVSAESVAAEHLKRAIESGGCDVATQKPASFPQSAALLQEIDQIILADATARQFRPRQLSVLDAYVRGGGGLIVTGGEETFGAAAYELTAFEKMLPVVATEQPVEQQKSLALVLIVDKSRSMLQENRLGLAKEAAKKVAEVLQERDQVGVLAFGDESQWISRLAPLNDKDEVLARIDKLEAQGLTNMYPAIERAYLSLSQADADSRHVILLTDGVPTPGDFDDVARRMAAAGITVSTVSLGKGADQTILKDISRIAGGSHHHVDNPDDLPKILERETRTAAAKVTGEAFTPDVERRLPGLNIESAPPLAGYVATSFKPGAQLLLTAGEGDPLLVWGGHRRGKAMVLASDLGKSAQGWREWDGYDAFWNRLVAYTMRDASPGDVKLQVRQQGQQVRVTLDAVTRDDVGSHFITDGKATLSATAFDEGGDMQAKILDMPQVSPGRYEAVFDAEHGQRLTLDVGLQVGGKVVSQQRRGLVVDYPDEFRLHPTDESLLKSIAAITGGKYDPTPEEIFAPDGRTVPVAFPLWPYVLIAALLVYLADVAVRRMGMSDRDTATKIKERRAA